MARYQVIIAYDGREFLGFQRQGNGRTVQAEIEKALQNLGWKGRSLLAAGRTDAGVHAVGQVVSFDLDWHHAPEALCRALNAFLPPDVAARHVEPAVDDFHPRFHACWRMYQYRLYFDTQRHPLRERYAWRVYPQAEKTILTKAALLLLGEHDFAALGSPPEPNGSTVRTVYQTDWQESDGEVIFTVTANAFLYHMVRRMVFLQVLAGQQRWELSEMEKVINFAQPSPPGLAPAQGLTLTAVGYWPYGKDNPV